NQPPVARIPGHDRTPRTAATRFLKRVADYGFDILGRYPVLRGVRDISPRLVIPNNIIPRHRGCVPSPATPDVENDPSLCSFHPSFLADAIQKSLRAVVDPAAFIKRIALRFLLPAVGLQFPEDVFGEFLVFAAGGDHKRLRLIVADVDVFAGEGRAGAD